MTRMAHHPDVSTAIEIAAPNPAAGRHRPVRRRSRRLAFAPSSAAHALAWSSLGLLTMVVGYALGWLDRPYALAFFYIGLVGMTIPCGALLLARGSARRELKAASIGLGVLLYLGYFLGDEVLAATGRRLRSAVRGRDLVARFGGDEFLVLANGLSTRDDASELVDRIHHAFDAPVRTVGGDQISVNVSIGIAVQSTPAADDGTPAQRLLAVADTDVLRRKRSNPNRKR